MIRIRRLGQWLLPFVLGALVGGGSIYLVGPSLWGQPFHSLSRRVEATIYLPTQRNDKQPFSDEEWHGALQKLVTEFGGATLGPPMEGYWYEKGRLQREPVRPVIVSFAPERLKRFQELVRELGRVLGQESIYTRYEEPRIELTDIGRGV